jgi:hypothetical protein
MALFFFGMDVQLQAIRERENDRTLESNVEGLQFGRCCRSPQSTHCGHSSFQTAAGRNLSDIFTLAGDMAAPPLAGIDPVQSHAWLESGQSRTA